MHDTGFAPSAGATAADALLTPAGWRNTRLCGNLVPRPKTRAIWRVVLHLATTCWFQGPDGIAECHAPTVGMLRTATGPTSDEVSLPMDFPHSGVSRAF